MNWIRRHVAGILVGLVIVVALVVGGLVLIAFGQRSLDRSIDRLGDRADRALATATDVRVRVDGLEAAKADADDIIRQGRELAAALSAGANTSARTIAAGLDRFAASLDRFPGQVAAAGLQVVTEAGAQLAAAADVFRGAALDLSRSGDRLAGALSAPIQHDHHIVGPLIQDLVALAVVGVPTLLANVLNPA